MLGSPSTSLRVSFRLRYASRTRSKTPLQPMLELLRFTMKSKRTIGYEQNTFTTSRFTSR
jgi:hypothetical protein